MVDFSKKTILITDGTQGVGKALADLFRSKGSTVIVIARHVEDDPYQFCCDVTVHEQVDKTFDEIFQKFGKIDLLVNNVGAGLGGAVEYLSYEYIDDVIKTNLMSSIYCTKAILSRTPADRELRIINISSIGAFGVQPFRTLYSVAKAGINMFTVGMRQELHGSNVKVCCITLGDTRTDFGKHHPNDFRTDERYGNRMMIGNETNIERSKEGKDKRMPLEKATTLMYKVITKKKYKKAYYFIGGKYKLLYCISRLFNTEQISEIVRKLFEK